MLDVESSHSHSSKSHKSNRERANKSTHDSHFEENEETVVSLWLQSGTGEAYKKFEIVKKVEGHVGLRKHGEELLPKENAETSSVHSTDYMKGDQK